ncbi:MAG: tape measure protein, partial [Cyanobacteria bacterium J06642_9]
MATTLGALVLELGLDDSRYKTQLVNAQRQAIAAGKQIERQFKAGGGSLNLKAEVDDSRLYDLNQHLDIKRQHFGELQAFLAQNPLQVRVDASEIEQAEQGMLRLEKAQKRSQLQLSPRPQQQLEYQSDRPSPTGGQFVAQEAAGSPNRPIEIRSASIEATLASVHESVEKAAGNVLELSSGRIRFDQRANRFRWAEGENKGQYVSNAVVQAVTGVKLSIDNLAKQQEQTSIESIKEGFFEGIGENFGNQVARGLQKQVSQRYGADIKKFGHQLQEVFNPNKLDKFEDALVSILEDLFVYSDEQERNQKLGQYAQRFGTGVKEAGMQVAGQGVKLAAQPLRIRKRVQLARSMELATQMADEIEVPDLEDPEKIKRIALLSGGVDYQEGGLNTYFSRNVMKNVLGDDTEAVPVPNVYSNSKDLGRLFDVKKALVQGLGKITGNAELNEMGEEIPVDKLLNIAIEAGFNPDAVIMEAVRRAYEKKYPDKQFVFGGTSAGTIAAEEATAIAERGGATNTKGFGATLGLTGLTQTASPENFKAIVGDLDPLYLTLFGSGGIDRESLTKTQRKVLDATMKEMPLPPDLLQGMLKPSANTEVVKGAGMAHHLGQFMAEPDVQKILSEFLGTEQTPEFQGKAGTSAFKTYADMFSQYEALDRTFRALAGEQGAMEEMGQGKYAFVTPEGKLRKNFGPEQERFDLEYAADEFQVNKRVKGVAAEEGQKFKRIMGDLVGALKDVEEVDPTKIEAIAKEFRDIFGTAPKLKEGDRDRIERIARGESPEEVGFKLERTGPRLEDLEKLKQQAKQAEAEAIAVPEPQPDALTEAAKVTKTALAQEMPPEQVSGNMAIAFAEKAGGILKEMASGAGEALGRKAEEILVSRINNLLAQVPGQRDVLEANPRQIQKVSDLTPEDIQRLSALGTEDLVKLLGSGANIAGNVAKGGAAIAIGTGQAIAPMAAQGAKALGSKAQQAMQGAQEAGLIEESQRRIMALKSAAEKAGALLPGRQNQGKAYADVVTKLLPALNKEIDQAIAALPPADRMATKEGSQLANLKSQVSKLEKQMQGLVEQLRQVMAQQEEVSGEDIIDAEVISEIETLAFGGAQVRQLQAAQPPPIQPPSAGVIQKQIKDLGKSFSVQSKAITTLGADSSEGRQIARDIANAADEARAAIESLLESLGDNATTGLRQVAGASRQRITKAEKKASRVLDTEGDAQNLGQDVGEGLNQGIRGSIQEVQQTARLLAQAAIESTKGELDIQSPSKVFRWIGRQVGAGFRVGVTESMKGAVSNSPVGEFAKRSKKEAKQVAQDFKVHFGQAKQFVTGLLKAFVGFQVLSFIGPFLQDFARQSIEAAMGAQQLERSLTFVMGSAQAAKETIRALRDEANELGTNAAASIQGYFQISASTRDTSLEGVATDQIASASSSAASAYNLSIAQAESVNTAISQMASKGKVSAEELRQQLSEALPGAFQVAARAMGVTTQELDRMLDRGELLSEEFLPRFAQQLSAETSAGVVGAANSAQASLNRLENQITEIKVAFGEGLIPVRKLGTDILAKGIEGLIKILPVLTTLATTFAARFAGNLIVTMNLGAKAAGILISAILRLTGVLKAGASIKGMAAAIALLRNNLLSAAKATLKFAVQFAIIQGVIDLAKMMGKAFKDGGEEINQFADQAIQSMEKYRAAIAEARGETEDFFASLPKGKSQIQGESLLEDFLFLGDIFGDQNIRALEGGLRKAFEFSPVGLAMRGMGREPISQSEKVATDQEIARNEVMGQMNRTLSEVYNQIGLDGQGANEVARLRELDRELQRLQGRRRAIRPGDSSARRQLDSEIDALLQEREVLAKPVGQLQQKLAAEIKAIEATIQELDEKAATDLVDQETYEKQSKQLQEQLEAAQSAQDKFNGLVRQSVNIVGMLSREFQGVSDRLRDINARIEIGSALQRKAIADIRAGGATAGQTRTLEYLSQQDELRRRIEANQEAMRDLSSLLSGSEVTRALDVTGIGSLQSIGPSELASSAERLGEGREREVLEIAAQRYEELQQLQVETANLEAEISSARANAQETMVQLSKDIAEFYRGIAQQAEELSIATKESQNQTALMQAKSKLQQALVGFSKSFLNEFVDSLIGLVEALNEPLQNAIAAQQQILAASQGYQQIMQQSMGFQQMMPGMIPGQQLGGRLGQGTLVGIGGDTGRSSGPHLDIRYSRNYDPNRNRPTDEHLDRFAIDGVPLTQGRITSEHRSRNSRRPGHDGVDFGLNVGAQITTTVPIQSVSQPVWDEGGGGWYTTVTFEDGVQMNLLHLDPSSRNAGIGTGGAPIQQAASRPSSGSMPMPQVTGPGRIPRGGTLGQAERVQSDPAGAVAIVQAAQQLGLNPLEFAALMSFESAGTFNPNIRGGDGNLYKGLIQFSPLYRLPSPPRILGLKVPADSKLINAANSSVFSP